MNRFDIKDIRWRFQVSVTQKRDSLLLKTRDNIILNDLLTQLKVPLHKQLRR